MTACSLEKLNYLVDFSEKLYVCEGIARHAAESIGIFI
jgi:hypothetical protein